MDDTRLHELETRVAELEMVQELLLRLMSTTRPLCNVLEQYGATESQERALLKFLDELVERVRGPADNHPSRAYFDMHLVEILPSTRHDRELRQLIIDTLKVERPAYRELHAYITEHKWLHT